MKKAESRHARLPFKTSPTSFKKRKTVDADDSILKTKRTNDELARPPVVKDDDSETQALSLLSTYDSD